MLVVVVSSDGQVTQKAVDARRVPVRRTIWCTRRNYLNTEFAGLRLLDVRDAVMARLQQERTLYDELLARALRLAQAIARRDGANSRAFHVEGAASLIGDGARRRSRWPRCARCWR